MVTYREYLADPDAVLHEVRRNARRERAAVVHELVVVPLKLIFGRLSIRPLREATGAAS